MTSGWKNDDRGASSVIGTLLLVGVAVVLGATVAVLGLGLTDSTSSEAPSMSVSYSLVDDGSEQIIAITHQDGENLRAENLYVTGSKDIDIGGRTSVNDSYASPRERFIEGNNGPQVNVGEYWEAGETVYIDPVGSVDDVTIQIGWSRQPIEGRNPGTPRGEDSYVIAQFTVGE